MALRMFSAGVALCALLAAGAGAQSVSGPDAGDGGVVAPSSESEMAAPIVPGPDVIEDGVDENAPTQAPLESESVARAADAEVRSADLKAMLVDFIVLSGELRFENERAERALADALRVRDDRDRELMAVAGRLQSFCRRLREPDCTALHRDLTNIIAPSAGPEVSDDPVEPVQAKFTVRMRNGTPMLLPASRLSNLASLLPEAADCPDAGLWLDKGGAAELTAFFVATGPEVAVCRRNDGVWSVTPATPADRAGILRKSGG